MCVRSQEGQDCGQSQHLQLQAEPHQRSQDPQEEAGQGHSGRQEDGIHQEDQPRQQATGQGTGGWQATEDAEIQDHPTKEIIYLNQRLNTKI